MYGHLWAIFRNCPDSGTDTRKEDPGGERCDFGSGPRLFGQNRAYGGARTLPLTPKFLPKNITKPLLYALDLISKELLDTKWVSIETLCSRNLGKIMSERGNDQNFPQGLALAQGS